MAKKKTSNSEPQIYDLLQDIHGRITTVSNGVQALDKKLDLHIQETKFELKGIRDLDLKQNEILQEHHDRSNQLKRENDLNEERLRRDMVKADQGLSQRVDSLEAPRKWLKSTWAMLVAGGATATAVIKIIELFQHGLK